MGRPLVSHSKTVITPSHKQLTTIKPQPDTESVRVKTISQTPVPDLSIEQNWDDRGGAVGFGNSVLMASTSVDGRELVLLEAGSSGILLEISPWVEDVIGVGLGRTFSSLDSSKGFRQLRVSHEELSFIIDWLVEVIIDNPEIEAGTSIEWLEGLRLIQEEVDVVDVRNSSLAKVELMGSLVNQLSLLNLAELYEQ